MYCEESRKPLFCFCFDLDYQPLFGKMSPRSSPEGRNEDRARESGGNRAYRKAPILNITASEIWGENITTHGWGGQSSFAFSPYFASRSNQKKRDYWHFKEKRK